MFVSNCYSKGYANCLVTNILQNRSFVFNRKKKLIQICNMRVNKMKR